MTAQPTGARLDRAKAMIVAVHELPPGAAAARVRGDLADDPELRDYVLRLLRGSEAAETTFGAVRSAAAALIADERPDRIGPYTILDTLGQGGMGTVYLAEQHEPVHRRVALKLVKLGMDSGAIVRRFEHERQALALMDHDGIARVHDCGTSERGQPFFVMELVEGEPITTWCDRRRLPIAERLRLLQRVCAAVQHAHQKGVVHRDLKPSNVLVADGDGEPRVKVIDFGLAKAMDQRLGDAALVTTPGQIVGTVEYMAPEQADAAQRDVDTRADVYSLGVLLYELLVGSLPFADTELRRAGMLELYRLLQTVEPPRPSARFAALPAAQQAQVADARAATVPALRRTLARDLDWVVAKAIEKDRARRYDGADALAADLQRFLQHEPLQAGPPSAGYRLRKFVRRNRGQVAAAGAVLLTAIVGGAIATNFAFASLRLADEKSAKVREFDQLAGMVLHARAVERERELFPPWPERIPALQRWLDEDLGRLQAMRPGIERTLADLRARAQPRSAEIVEADRRSHPRWAELQGLQVWIDTLRRAEAARQGDAIAEVEVPPALAALDLQQLYRHTSARVSWDPGQRTLPGQAPLGLALARLLAERAAGTSTEENAATLLLLALAQNGRDDEARAVIDDVVARAAPAERARVVERFRGYREIVDGMPQTLAEQEARLAALQAEVDAPRTFEFALEADRFLHDTLVRLLADVAALEAEPLARVRLRLHWAQRVAELSRDHPNARCTWDEARAAIAAADGERASELYRGAAIELADADVVGLVPIGMNPVTRLWEFYDLRSAWGGRRDPATLPIPAHAADGSIAVDDDTGIVFVLLPGGTFRMGAQAEDPAAPNFDLDVPWYMRPVHEVRLEPFLLARHELTQGQWSRLWLGKPDGAWPSRYRAGAFLPALSVRITGAHPVTQVDWFSARQLLLENGMVLPTEAQWEYACRAGTSTPWSCAQEELRFAANLSDAAAAAANAQWAIYEPWSDGHVVTAAVGALRPNPWGLHDLHGNVAEWCRDPMFGYEWPASGGEGLRGEDGVEAVDRMTRGGSMNATAAVARSAMRNPDAPSLRVQHIGVRAARRLHR